jgi:hypothetical protein
MAEEDGIGGGTGYDLDSGGLDEFGMGLLGIGERWEGWRRHPMLRVPWQEVDMRRVSPFVLCSETVFFLLIGGREG